VEGGYQGGWPAGGLLQCNRRLPRAGAQPKPLPPPCRPPAGPPPAASCRPAAPPPPPLAPARRPRAWCAPRAPGISGGWTCRRSARSCPLWRGSSAARGCPPSRRRWASPAGAAAAVGAGVVPGQRLEVGAPGGQAGGQAGRASSQQLCSHRNPQPQHPPRHPAWPGPSQALAVHATSRAAQAHTGRLAGGAPCTAQQLAPQLPAAASSPLHHPPPIPPPTHTPTPTPSGSPG
jgi:hypothetical protein